VLYEMLAGEPPHTGPNAASILMRILTENPRALSDIRPTVPLHVAGAVAKAVEKLPADRFQTARQFHDALEDPAFRFSRTTAAVAAAPAVASAPVTSRWDRRSLALGAAAVFFAATTVWFALKKPAVPTLAESVMAFQLMDSVPAGVIPTAGPGGWLAYTRDGALYVRPPGASQASELESARGNTGHVSFSPDGEWITFTQPAGDGMVLRKSPTRGGNAVTLGTFRGVALAPFWADDGWIYVTIGPVTWSVGRVPEIGGAVDTLLTGPRVPIHYAKVPGHPTLFFGYYNSNATDPSLYAIDLASRDTTNLIAGGYWPEWSPTGHLLYARDEGSLFAAGFDAGSGTVVGSPTPVLDSLAEALPEGRFDLSPAGTLVYVAGRQFRSTASNAYSLRLDSLDGGSERIPLPPSDHWDAKFSPDGRRLAYIRNDHVWIYDLDLGTHTQLTGAGSRRHNPAWSPDGSRIVFSQAERDNIDLFVVNATGGNAPVERWGGSEAADYATQWLPDNSVLVQTQDARSDILQIRKGDSVTALLQADWVERDGRVSPDERWLAYISGEGGRADLFVRRWPSLQNKVKVSAGDAPMANSSFALWSKDSRTLYYHQGRQIVAASVTAAHDSLRITSRRVVRDSVRGILADLHPDGRRLLFLDQGGTVDSASARAVRRLVVITNWASALRQRMAPAQPR
jgi:serine/threonine-protein kinase